MAGVKEEIARQLLKKRPHLGEDNAKAVASNATKKMRHLETILRQQNRPYWVSLSVDSVRAGGYGAALAGVFEAAGQLVTNGSLDMAKLGQVSVVGATSAAAGAATHHLIINRAINSEIGSQFFRQAASAVGLPTGMASATLPGHFAGGAVGSAVYALGMWLTGNMTDQEAARSFTAGTAGSAVGAMAGTGVVALATAYGTAGTGVAISGLSGAAANSAALAWLGGGTVAAGGGGTALGFALVGGVVTIVAVVAGAGFYWGFAAYDDSDANHRHQYVGASLIQNPALLKELCRKRWMPNMTPGQ